VCSRQGSRCSWEMHVMCGSAQAGTERLSCRCRHLGRLKPALRKNRANGTQRHPQGMDQHLDADREWMFALRRCMKPTARSRRIFLLLSAIGLITARQRERSTAGPRPDVGPSPVRWR